MAMCHFLSFGFIFKRDPNFILLLERKHANVHNLYVLEPFSKKQCYTVGYLEIDISLLLAL